MLMPNPLLPNAPTPPPPPEVVEDSPVLHAEVEARFGPQTPLYISDPQGPDLPFWQVDTDPALWVVGVHGGSGATTVAALLGSGALELYRYLPVSPPGAPPARVLLTARTHALGLHYAAGVAAQWATGTTGIELLGIAVVDDAPRLPPVMVREITRLAGMVPALWHLPWCEQWRTAVAPPTDMPRRTRKSITRILAAAHHARSQHAQAQPSQSATYETPAPDYSDPSRRATWPAVS